MTSSDRSVLRWSGTVLVVGGLVILGLSTTWWTSLGIFLMVWGNNNCVIAAFGGE